MTAGRPHPALVRASLTTVLVQSDDRVDRVRGIVRADNREACGIAVERERRMRAVCERRRGHVVQFAHDVVGREMDCAARWPLEDVQVDPVRVGRVARRPDAGHAK